MARPIYAWQGDDAHLCTGDTALAVADTQRLIRLVTRAWEENWSAPRLTSDTLRFSMKKKSSPSRFRDFELAKDLYASLGDWEAPRPCVFRRCE